MHPLEQQTLRFLSDQMLTEKCRRIVVATSGGADSTALLHVLAALREKLGVVLTAVYVDHGLRPEETPLERKMVKQQCQQLGVAYTYCQVNATVYAKEKKLSLEHGCRDLRYQVLRDVAAEKSPSLIAVAHTADDQVENVLLGLLRGAGGRGLSGMRVVNAGVIRPFLTFSKNELLSYLEEKQVEYCEDSSNLNLRFLRNRVRHKLLPFLEEHFGPGVHAAIGKSAANLAEDEGLLQDLTNSALQDTVRLFEKNGEPAADLYRQPFSQLAAALQRRVVEQLLWKLDAVASYIHILDVTAIAKQGETGKELHLHQGLRVVVTREKLQFFYPVGKQAWRGKAGAMPR